jgi:shikimate kinase
MHSLILIGFMGSGKSSVGRRLARRLGCGFLDLDSEIERVAGQSIPQIFALEGEEKFREYETRVLQSVLQEEAVIASGGGLVTRPENRALLREAAARGAHVVYLKASPQTLAERIRRQPGTRPLIDGPGAPLDTEATRRRVEELLAMRAQFYEECATVTIQSDGAPFETVIQQITEAISAKE